MKDKTKVEIFDALEKVVINVNFAFVVWWVWIMKILTKMVGKIGLQTTIIGIVIAMVGWSYFMKAWWDSIQ